MVMKLLNAVLLITLVFAIPVIIKTLSYRKDKDVPFLAVFLVSCVVAFLSYGFASNYVIAYGDLYIFSWVAIICMTCTISHVVIGLSKFFTNLFIV